MLTSLRALRAFAAVTRCGSVAGAARELNVTPSAVSHLLRRLEQDLGVDLSVTQGPTFRLTEPGERFGRQLSAAFEAIATAIAGLRHQASDVRISGLSSFLTLWLVPRLPGFHTGHPAVRLLLSTGTRPVDLNTEPYECAIRWGRGRWPGLEATLLFHDQPVVVTNPRLLDASRGPAWLPRLAARGRPQDWPLVAAALGWGDREPVLTLETRALTVQAATAGMGAAVVDRCLVADLLTQGLLAEIRPDPPLPMEEGHWIVALPEKLRMRPVREFRDWLVAEANRG